MVYSADRFQRGRVMRLLVFQHIDCEHPGQLRQFLAKDDADCTVVALDRGDVIPDLEPFDALWVMGGPMDVWETSDHPWLVDEKRAITRWVGELQRPYLGLCLGHQLLADALGGRCGPQDPPEIGVLDIELTAAGEADPIFAAMPKRQRALQWHSTQVVEPPPGATVLAESAVCPVQAMRVGPAAWSMQYHLEVEADTVDNWSKVPAYRAALKTTLGPSALPDLERAAALELDRFVANAGLLYDNFVAAVTTRLEPSTP